MVGEGVVEGEDGRFFPEFLVELRLLRSALCFGDFGAWEGRLGLGLFELFLLGLGGSCSRLVVNAYIGLGFPVVLPCVGDCCFGAHCVGYLAQRISFE